MVNTSHLSFAETTELKDIFQLEQGSVTPFGIINDTYNKVVLVIDIDLKDKQLLFNPNLKSMII